MQAIIQCPQLEKLDTRGCTGLDTLMLWTDKLTELDITDSKVRPLCSTNRTDLAFPLCDKEMVVWLTY